MSTVHCRWLFLLFFLTTWTSSDSKEVRVVCYYTNWSVYRPGTAKFSPQNINPYLCTHLIYAFGGFTKENTLKPFDKYQDIEKGGYAKFTGLKTYNKNLKTMLAIGGWNEGSSRFSPMVASQERRKEFIKNAIKFLRQNHFDGLDLDWEYPSFRDGGKSRDRDNYAQLVQEMREEFERESEKTGRPRLLLTMAVPAGIEYINKGYDVPKLTKYLDWMNILSYDYHSAFEPAVNNHAPLYPLEEPSEYNYDTELNIDYTIKHYLEKGADPNKLVLGIPTYGRSYTLFNPDANEVGAPADGPGDMGEATRENGYLAYYEICENVKSQDWDVVQPNPEAMGPYAFKGNQWVGYDDEDIARKKSSYVAENNLGGIMFWSIDNDDFRGNCHGKPYPIIEAAKEELIRAYGLTDENLVSQAKPTKSKTKRPLSTKSSEKSDDENKSVSTRRNRVKTKPERNSSSNRLKSRRKEARTTTEGTVYSSLELVTPSYTTPAPPPTPGMGGEFKCEDEGFYPHPKDCKKYFWCLSGPGELGIVAHQFTCPAGLYFNKAADSCDYTRNVLCSKKLAKSTTTTSTTPSTTTTTAATSTARVPPKITAATSRTTVFRTTTTTEAYEEDYEYEDEEEDTKNSEEDPKVIKELLDLIRKAGGIEQLEKQLKIQEDGSASVSSSDATTPSSISKSLVERVLGKAAKNKVTERKNFLNRNSRGPQNAGLESTEEKQKQDKSRPQYTTITRQRTQRTEDKEEKDESEENHDTNKRQYINIRRPKVTSTTEDSEDSRTQINRNKILGEDGDEEVEVDDEETRKKASTPQYVNIRRQRPSTTEGTSTSKYTVIRRGTTKESEVEIEEETEKKSATSNDASTEKNDRKRYQILRRSTTTTTEPSTNESSSKRRGTTQADTEDKVTTAPGNKYVTFRRGKPTEASIPEVSATTPNGLSSSISEELTTNSKPQDPTTLEASSTTASSTSPSVSSNPESKLTDSETPIFQTQSPVLFEPRPFSISTYGPRTNLKAVTEPTRATKVSDTNYKRLKSVVVTQSDSTTEKPTVLRSRPSRFKVTTGQSEATTRSRKRFSTTTTESYSDSYEDYDLNRSYRPSEIADLSSLTAVDLSTLKDLNRFGGGSRSKRIRPSTTTTQSPEDNLKTSSRTLSIARKQLSGTVFGSSRRASLKSQEEDQINSGSDTTSRIRAFTRAPLSTTTEESRSTLRNKKVIRRLRPVTKPESSTIEAENLIENASSRPLYSRRFRGSTIAEEVNKLAPTTEKLSKVNEEEDISAEEEENIKLSESNIRENSNVNNGNNINSEDGKKVKKVLKRIRGKIDDEKVTEPNVIVRTRKIVRKLSTTEASVPVTTTESSEPSTQNRRRKIIRRLRPTTASTPTEKTLYIRGRPFLNQITTDKSNEENDKAQDLEKSILDVKIEDKSEKNPDKNEENKDEDLEEPEDPFKDAVKIQIFRPVETDKAQNETGDHDVDQHEDSVKDESEEESNENQDREIVTTTAKNYVNPILSRQKNRPAFRRPKLTTQSPSSTTTFAPRYRTNSRFSTPSSIETSSETANRLVKISSRTRSTTEPNSLLILTSTTQAVDSNSTTDESVEVATPQIEESDDTESDLNNSTETINSENIAQTTYEYADVTPLGTSTPSYETNVTQKDGNDTINNPAILASSEQSSTPEISTLEITTVQYKNEEETNQTEATTINPEFAQSINETQNHSTETTTIVSKEETSSVTTPVYHPKSTLRSILNRPKYVVPKRLTSTESPSTRARFVPRSKNRSILRPATANSLTSTTPLTPKNKFLLRYSTTERTTKVTEEPEIDEYEDEDKIEDEVDEVNIKQISSTTRPFTKKTKPRISNLSFGKTTEAPKVEEPLKDIDTEAVKNRNKNLFSSKKRKMNTPFSGVSTEKAEVTSEATPLTTTPAVLESVTKPTKIFETTEILTTLHHIFAETELIGNATTTETPKTSSESKLEKLIEVNRIVEVHDVNDPLVQDNKVVDKVGVINRVTVVKVVDGNPSPEENEIQKTNETAPEVATVKEISGEDYGVINPLEASREDRKFEIYGGSKILNYKENEKDRKNNVAEIIDGKSNINVITPRPYYSTEASTISLEALFQKADPSDKLKASSDDELLETDNSRYINVRVLGKDGKEIKDRREEEYITMKAQVVEVTPKNTEGVIKIVPIQVATSRKLIVPSDFDTKIENGVSKVNLHILDAKTK